MMSGFIRTIVLAAVCVGPVYAQTSQTTQSGTREQSVTATPPPTHLDSVSTKRPSTEDWTTLSLGKSGLRLDLDGGVVLSKIEEPEFTRELVRTEWRAGDPIELYVIRPHGVAKPPVILYLYNYTSDTDRYRDDGWCRRATKDGFAAVGFVSALSGQRFHAPRPMKQWFVSELQEALATSTHDVQMILNYLARRGDFDMRRVGIFGQGSGGAIALLTASVDSRIDAVDVIDPWGSWQDWLRDSQQIPDSERKSYLDNAFLSKVSRFDPIEIMSSTKAKATRIQETMDDPITPPSARTKIIAAAPKSYEVVRYDTAAQHVQAYRKEGLSGWLELHLPDDSSASF